MTPNQEDQTTTTLEPRKRSGSKPRHAPRYRVILLNDDVNEFEVVVQQVRQLTPLTEQQALVRTIEAHKTGRSLLLVTHKERAELYQEQFRSLVPPIGIDIEEEQP